MNTRTGIFRDLAEENGLLDLFEQMWETRLIMFVQDEEDGESGVVDLAGSHQEALEKCSRTDGYYQIIHVQEMSVSTHRVPDLVEQARQLKVQEGKRLGEEQVWELQQVQFEQKYGRLMNASELNIFCPRHMLSLYPFEVKSSQIILRIIDKFRKGEI